MALELILTELRPFELSHFRQYFALIGNGVSVINFSYRFAFIFCENCILVVDVMKMCTWVFDRMTAF